MNPIEAYDQVLEQTLAAERAVLGGILIDPRRWDDAAEVVGPDEFFRPAHRVIWHGCRRLIASGAPIDPLTVRGALSPEELDEVGGPAYLMGLVDGVPRSSNVAAYARQVKDYALRRQLEQIGRQILGEAQHGVAGGDQILAQAEAALIGLRNTQHGGTLLEPEDRASAAFAALEAAQHGRRRGVPTGLAAVDEMTFGLRGGQLIVLGARPSQGKTALSLTIAIAAGVVGPVLFASLEMSAEQINLRELSARSAVSHSILDSGRLGDAEATRVAHGMAQLAAGRIAVLDQAGATIGQIRAAARRLAAKAGMGLALVVVDYLQLMRSEPGTRPENRTLEVSQFSAGLKMLAREMNTPVLALSQLSRESEKRQDKRPLLADLRESGALEQDADLVMLLHRPGVYERNPEDARAELIIAKQRNGPTGIARLIFDAETMRFRDEQGGLRVAG
jgi:replicative DNA helicase